MIHHSSKVEPLQPVVLGNHLLQTFSHSFALKFSHGAMMYIVTTNKRENQTK
jgi:hypothetical protein